MSVAGSATGAGTLIDPWTFRVAIENGGYPTNTLVHGDTVWLRGGTYTGQFLCQLSGADGSPITFRGYPGERPIIDGNYNPAETGNTFATIRVMGTTGYIWCRDLEFTNSQTDRWCLGLPTPSRGDSFMSWVPGCKLINCVLHDDGEAIYSVKTAEKAEYHGNLTYYGGYWTLENEKDAGIVIDLIPAGGTPIALNGANVAGGDVTSGTLTFSHNHSGDFLVVAAGTRPNENYTGLAVTYDGVSMTLAAGAWDGGASVRPVALFYLATGALHQGAHNVVVTFSGTDSRKMAVSQSFVNVHQTTPPNLVGSWETTQFIGPPTESRVTVTSAANHMVVDATNVYGAYAGAGYPGGPYYDYDVYAPDDNTLVRWSGTPAGLNEVGMSYAPGAASVKMGWTWTGIKYGHGHGIYPQIGKEVDDAVAVAGDNTVTSPSSPWVAADVGKTAIVEGGGSGGGNLVTTISHLNAANSIELTDAVVTSVNPAGFKWTNGITIQNNLFLPGVGANSISAQGTSGGIGVIGSTITGNLAVGRPFYLGGAGDRFIFGGTTFDSNYSWGGNLNLDYNTLDFSGLVVTKNYIASASGLPAVGRRYTLAVGGTGKENTFIGSIDWTQADYPNNVYTYVTPAAPPGTNLVIVLGNSYETNRANIYVYNWHNDASVNVDLSGVVAPGTMIYILNAADYYNVPVFSGEWLGTPIALSMTLTQAAPVGSDWTPPAATGPAFNAFIVRAQSAEYWRTLV